MIRLIRGHLKGAALFFAILAPLSMLVEVFMDLQQPTLMSSIIDQGVAAGDLDYVLRTGGRMILYAFTGLLGGAGCSICTGFAGLRLGQRVRSRLFSHIFTFSGAEVDRLEPSGLITRLTSDVSQVQEMLMMLLRGMSRAPMTFFGGIIMAFLLSPRLALIICAALPLLLICAVVVIRSTVPMYTTVQQRMDRLNTNMRENLLGVRVVKSFNLENRQIEQFEEANSAYAEANIKAQKTTFLLMPIVTLVMNLSVVAVLWMGGLMQIEGALPMGKIMAFVNYMVQITHSLVMLVSASLSISRARASAVRILSVLDTPPSVNEAPSPRLPLGADLVFDNVSFGYGGAANPLTEKALSGISVEIKEGRRIGIIGATGCGKSTFASLAARIYDPDRGSVRIGGVDIKEIPTVILRQKVGIVLQESLLFSGTVAENLAYGKIGTPGGSPAGSPTEEELKQAVESAQAAEFLTALPAALDAPVAQRGRNFSGGQKQRLSIARSLLHNPDILIMDDSSSALDLVTEARLQEAIRKTRKGKTLITIAQRISSIMDCDEILVMDKGRIVEKGNHRRLMENDGIYRAIALSQLGEEALNV
jgi:ATP-binding cassette subfamily B protein